MRDFIKDILSYDRKERAGVLVLLFLCVTLSCIRLFALPFLRGDVVNDDIRIASEIICDKDNSKTKTEYAHGKKTSKDKKEALVLFDFDPNIIDKSTWVLLGLTEKQADVVLNYRRSGAIFRSKKDLKKLFVVSATQYEVWEPFILLPDEANPSESKDPYFADPPLEEMPVETLSPVGLNSADSLQLLDVPGIGPFYAGAISRYRLSLGGFVRVEQLMDVWKVDSTRLSAWRPFLLLDTTLVSKIDVNRCTIDELGRHPYMTWPMARSIVNMREMHGAYRDIADIMRSKIIDEAAFYKIAPYLKVDDDTE